MSAEPEQPNRKYMHPDSLEAAEKRAAQLAHEKGIERRAWRTLWHTYERCVEISELVWQAKLGEASIAQQVLAEAMRDRRVSLNKKDPGDMEGALWGREIPVPLFTPRDRAQFIKEVAATLLISADRQNLHVYFPKDKPTDAETKPEAGNGSGIEAAPSTVESALDAEASHIAQAGAQ